MYLGETEEYKEELAMMIEEFLKQRIQGMKNEKGVYITPAFPKLLYVLEEDNIHEDSKYWYLTRLAAEAGLAPFTFPLRVEVHPTARLRYSASALKHLVRPPKGTMLYFQRRAS